MGEQKMKVDKKEYTDNEFNPIKEYTLSVNDIEFGTLKINPQKMMDVAKLNPDINLKESMINFIKGL
jgi:hypothetical protein